MYKIFQWKVDCDIEMYVDKYALNNIEIVKLNNY